MHTKNEILIRAGVAEIYRLAAPVERWPELLPHYRWVRILEDDGEGRRLVEMAALRNFIPVRWQAEQLLFPDVPRIVFRHVGGVTKGMEVKWVFSPRGDGVVRVSILHDLERGLAEWPLVGRVVADGVVGPFFVSNIADKTLGRIKELAEAGARRRR